MLLLLVCRGERVIWTREPFYFSGVVFVRQFDSYIADFHCVLGGFLLESDG